MTMPQFSPLVLESLIVEPLRYYFSTNTEQFKLIWDPDEKKRSMDIGAVNDFNKIPMQEKPRVLVDRGAYGANKTGIAHNMMSQKTFGETGGLIDKENLLFVQGTASVIVEARQKGTCETLTELVSRFLVWSSPQICAAAGFKEFAIPIQVSTCTVVNPEQETEIFSTTISVPWMKEDVWRVYTDGILFKSFVLKLVADGIPVPD
jgi:hypothetical protein